MVCFDLPVQSKKERKQASQFRTDLLDIGYYMFQNSIYCRNCVSYDRMDKSVQMVRAIAPDTGSISIFFLQMFNGLSLFIFNN